MTARWSDEEDYYLLANYEKHDLGFLAEVLDRSESAVKKRYYTVTKKFDTEAMPSKERTYFLSRTDRVVPKRGRAPKRGTVEVNPKTSGWTGKGNPYAHTKTGHRADLGITVRSGWEANVLRVLKSFDIPYEFEPTVFTYPVKRGNKAYTPDIYLKATGEWIEVKGYFDKNSQVKMKRFKKYYPEDFAVLTMIISKSSKKAREFCQELGVPTVLYYEEISRIYKGQIATWEGR